MSRILLKEVNLDFILKTGSNSLKQLAVQGIRALMPGRASCAQQPLLRNSLYQALKNINLELNRGDRLGILGRNGAGKSTLLRVLAKIYHPKSGVVTVEGSISTIFDINLGLNPEATGYENITLLGIMRGMSKRQALGLYHDIETFTELGDFLGAPVRTYSTGMQMKLAFSIATATSPDILLIDEIIGAGDMHFMEKAHDRVKRLISDSNILVLTSHSNDIIRQFCNKVMVLDHGEVQFIGPVDEGLCYYQKYVC